MDYFKHGEPYFATCPMILCRSSPSEKLHLPLNSEIATIAACILMHWQWSCQTSDTVHESKDSVIWICFKRIDFFIRKLLLGKLWIHHSPILHKAWYLHVLRTLNTWKRNGNIIIKLWMGIKLWTCRLAASFEFSAPSHDKVNNSSPLPPAKGIHETCPKICCLATLNSQGESWFLCHSGNSRCDKKWLVSCGFQWLPSLTCARWNQICLS